MSRRRKETHEFRPKTYSIEELLSSNKHDNKMIATPTCYMGLSVRDLKDILAWSNGQNTTS